MIRRLLWTLVVVCVATGSSIFAQNIIDTPESIAFDSVRNRYYVSCYGTGRIIAVDTSGEQTEFATGLGHCLGNQIVGDTLFVSASTFVVGLDMDSGNVIWAWTAPAGSAVDGLAADTSGNLYVSSPGLRRIYRIVLATGASDILTTDLPTSPQDITFDQYHNRLLVCSFSLNGPITGVSLPDGTQTTLVTCPYGYHDGITHDDRGNTYVGCAKAGKVMMWDSTFTDPPTAVVSGPFWVAGLDYNIRDDVIAVPDFYGDRMLLFEVFRPKLALSANTLGEITGDGDGHADPGESLTMTVTIRNDGWEATGITGDLLSLDPNIIVTTSSTDFPDMSGEGTTADAVTPFELTIDASCPDPLIAKLQLTLSAAGEFTFVDTILLFSGDTYGFTDDSEIGEGLWTHSSPGAGFVDQWHLDTYRMHSGITAWKAGGMGADEYANGNDSRLITPPFLLPINARLTFWQWIAAEANPGSDTAWDGAAVYISSGGDWVQLIPSGGYPYEIADNPASPFTAGTPCFSGSCDWAEVECDLSAYSGVVQLMFRFGSDAAATAEGWYIDDISVAYAGCCGVYTGGYTGNADCDTEGKMNLADVTKLIDRVYLSKLPLCCEENGNVDGDSEAKLNLADITKLIDHIYLSKQSTAICM